MIRGGSLRTVVGYEYDFDGKGRGDGGSEEEGLLAWLWRVRLKWFSSCFFSLLLLL